MSKAAKNAKSKPQAPAPAQSGPPPPLPQESNETMTMNVEELIGSAFGAYEENKINFKMLQTTLHLLARQMRLLEQQVELKFTADEDALVEGSAQAETKKGLSTQDSKGKGAKSTGKDVKRTSLEVTDDKGVLIVQKVPAARTPHRVGNIEVVTRSEFNLLEAQVAALSKITGPVPQPTMPKNKQLAVDIAAGNASLTGTMDAMQVNARIIAAEQALGKMAGLLTMLAMKGAVPPDMAKEIQGMLGEVRDLGLPIETMDAEGELRKREAEPEPIEVVPAITQQELQGAVATMQVDFTKNTSQLMNKATAAAEHAMSLAKSVAERLDQALGINKRIDALFSLTRDYAEQIKGFDSGLNNQLQCFQEQLQQMKAELKESLSQMDMSNKPESAAITEFKGAYEALTAELDKTFREHSFLDFKEKQLVDELTRLQESVEMLREQKADRDEVIDGLRDKADTVRLQGLLKADDFEVTRLELEKRLELCYEKFKKQDEVWLGALKDLVLVALDKAEVMDLITFRVQVTDKIKELSDTLKRLEFNMGEPKAAMLTRAVARGAHCSACLTPALIDVEDPRSSKPPLLPRLLLRGMARDEQQAPELNVQPRPEERDHVCLRWVGGSHTLISNNVTRTKYEKTDKPAIIPTKKYTGIGTDGRGYMMETELEPCIQCNPPEEEELPNLCVITEVGGGDVDQGAQVDNNADKNKEKMP